MKRTMLGLAVILALAMSFPAFAQTWVTLDGSVNNPSGGAFFRQYTIRNVPASAILFLQLRNYTTGSGSAPGVYANNLDADAAFTPATINSRSRWRDSNAGGSSAFLLPIYDPSANVRVALYSAWGVFRNKGLSYAFVYPPGKPTPLAPKGKTYNKRPVFSWSSVYGVRRYYLEIMQNGSVVRRATVSNTTAWKPSYDLALGTYTWRVRAWRVVSGAWSAQASFKIAKRKLGKPIPWAPAGNITRKRPTFSWTSVPRATWYVVQVNQGARVVKRQSVQDTAWRIGTDLKADKAYRWWVRAWNEESGYGPWSNPMDFFVKLKPPEAAVLISPGAPNYTRTTLPFTWRTVPDATHYYLQLNKEGVKVFGRWFAYDGTAATVTVPLSGLQKGKRYTWWILTWNKAGNGPWSAPLAFSIMGNVPPAKPVLIAPAGSIQTAHPSFQWRAASGATSYTLRVEKRTGGVWTYDTTSTSYGLPFGVDKDIAYTWSVRAVNAAGGTWSDPWVFKYEDQRAKWYATLSWGSTPTDVDLHALFADGRHISYLNKGSATTAPYAVLDWDDTSSYGPEEISVYSEAVGTLIFVHNYSGRTTGTPPFTSAGKVVVKTPAGTRTFTCQNTSRKYWKVCRIDSTTGAITTYNTYQDTEPRW